jgi:hypothetical protein
MAMRKRRARRRTLRSPIRRRSRRTTRKRTSKPSSAGSKIYSVVKNASGYLAFASQLTAKDYSVLNNQASYKNEDIATKAKIFANIAMGRLTGITPFKNGNMYGSETTPFTINPSGMVNKFTGLGIAGLLYKNLPIKQLPQKSKVGAVSKRLLLGGALGGLFDAPEGSSKTMASSPKVLGTHMTGIQQQNRSATMQTGMYSESQDSTGGSF